MSKILLVGAGAEHSIKDVEQGFFHALRARGVDVVFYALDRRLGVSVQWLQRLWRMKGSDPEQKPSWPEAIYRGSVEALEMALRHEVDWVLIVSGMFFHPDVLVFFRRAGIKSAVILTESPYQDSLQARFCEQIDVAWTNERTSAEKLGAGYLPAAYSLEQLHVSTEEAPAHDVVFVGTGWRERLDLLRGVDWSGIDLGLYGEWALLGGRAKLRQFVHPPVSNARAHALYGRAKIGLNLYRTSVDYDRRPTSVQVAESMNPRAYELAAARCFQLSTPRAEVGEIFGEAVPTFETSAQLEALVRHFLNAPDERDDLSTLARQRVLPHSFAARAAHVLADLDAFERPTHERKVS